MHLNPLPAFCYSKQILKILCVLKGSKVCCFAPHQSYSRDKLSKRFVKPQMALMPNKQQRPPCQVVFPLSEVQSFPNMHNFQGGCKQSAKCAVSWTVIWMISCVKLRSFKTYSFLSQTMPSARQTPGLLARREPRNLAKSQQLPHHLVSASPRAIGRASSASPRP